MHKRSLSHSDKPQHRYGFTLILHRQVIQSKIACASVLIPGVLDIRHSHVALPFSIIL